METKNLFTQIALITLGAIILFKVFQIDSNQKTIRDNINKSITEIKSAEKNLEAAQDEIANLEKQIVQFKAERNLYEAQKDSIVLNYRKAQAEDLEELEEIKEDIQENIDKLDRLRKLNDDFAFTTETSNKSLKEVIRQNHEELKKMIDSILVVKPLIH